MKSFACDADISQLARVRGDDIFIPADQVDKANAKLIVEAVNNHSRLLKENAELKQRADKGYTERMIVVRLLCSIAENMGWDYGVGVDGNTDWEDEWRNVIYVDTPKGQVSWHIAPHDKHIFDGIKKYTGKWDGTFNGGSIEFAQKTIGGNNE